MTYDMLKWDIYEISADESPLTGVMLRGRVRKYALQQGLNLLTENTEAKDVEGRVRIAVISGTDVSDISDFLKGIIPDSHLELRLEEVVNPVLSKLKVNDESRYTI